MEFSTKTPIAMTDKEKTYALFGLALGDGAYQSPSIYISHTDKQKEYVVWLELMAKKMNLNHKTRYNVVYKNQFGNFIYHYIRIRVPERHHLDKSNRFFDDSGKKILSKYILNRINALGLLFWWLGDGSLHVSHTTKNGVKRFGYLSTESFSLEENENLQSMLKARFDISTRVHTYRGYHRLYFNATSIKKLLDIFREYLPTIPESMRYKLNPKYGLFPERNLDSSLSNYSYESLFCTMTAPYD